MEFTKNMALNVLSSLMVMDRLMKVYLKNRLTDKEIENDIIPYINSELDCGLEPSELEEIKKRIIKWCDQ